MTAEQDQAGYGHDPSDSGRPVALLTGVGRTAGIGAGIAGQLAASGWDIAFTYWTRYDERMAWAPSRARPKPSENPWPNAAPPPWRSRLTSPAPTPRRGSSTRRSTGWAVSLPS
jgi:hypothetical protein